MQNLVWYNPAQVYGNQPYNNAYSNNTQYGNGSNSVYSGNSVIYRPGINSYGPATTVQNGVMYPSFQPESGPANPGFDLNFSTNGVPVTSSAYYYPGNGVQRQPFHTNKKLPINPLSMCSMLRHRNL